MLLSQAFFAQNIREIETNIYRNKEKCIKQMQLYICTCKVNFDQLKHENA